MLCFKPLLRTCRLSSVCSSHPRVPVAGKLEYTTYAQFDVILFKVFSVDESWPREIGYEPYKLLFDFRHVC